MGLRLAAGGLKLGALIGVRGDFDRGREEPGEAVAVARGEISAEGGPDLPEGGAARLEAATISPRQGAKSPRQGTKSPRQGAKSPRPRPICQRLATSYRAGDRRVPASAGRPRAGAIIPRHGTIFPRRGAVVPRQERFCRGRERSSRGREGSSRGRERFPRGMERSKGRTLPSFPGGARRPEAGTVIPRQASIARGRDDSSPRLQRSRARSGEFSPPSGDRASPPSIVGAIRTFVRALRLGAGLPPANAARQEESAPWRTAVGASRRRIGPASARRGRGCSGSLPPRKRVRSGAAEDSRSGRRVIRGRIDETGADARGEAGPVAALEAEDERRRAVVQRLEPEDESFRDRERRTG